MEKVNFKNSRGLNLVGQLYDADPDKLVILIHGWCSNKDRERFFDLANSVVEAGYSFLRFDQANCGESEGDEVTIKNNIDDVKSSIAFAKERGYSEIGLIGESLGGLAALSIHDDTIKARVLYAPVTHHQPLHFDKYIDEMNEKGFAIKHKDGRDFKLPIEYMEERKAVNREELLPKVDTPVLILHGDKDSRVPLQNSREAIEYLPEESELEVVPGAEHNLTEGYNQVIDSTIKWFNKYF